MNTAFRAVSGAGRNLLFGVSLAMSLSGCYDLMPKTSDATLASYGQTVDQSACGTTPIGVYKSQVYPYLRTNCMDCHSSMAPAFAGSDSTASYATAKPYLNAASPSQSVLYSRANDGHCGSSVCQKSGTDFNSGMQAWGAAETNPPANCASSGDPNGIANAGVVLLINGHSLQQVLSAAQDAGMCSKYQAAFIQNGTAVVPPKDLKVALSGASVYSDANCKNAATNVTIYGPNSGAGASGSPYQYFYVLEPSVGDRTLVGTISGYAVGFTVQLSIIAANPGPGSSPTPSPSPSALPSPAPSVKPSSAPSPMPSAAPSPAPTPCVLLQRQTAYSQTVWPLAKTNCAGCHANGSRPQFANATLATAYSVAIGLVNTTTPTSSRLYLKSKDGHCGACTATNGANFLTQMNLWFPAETTNNCSALTTPH
ncbi:MAG: hypothetical protein JST04_07940 [Bdellovibrionales bacterium]|nr:hypothetical protein [Bdellovibrionales bacterium]